MQHRDLAGFVLQTLQDWIAQPRLELVEVGEDGAPTLRRYKLRDALEKAGGAQEVFARLQALQKVLDLAKGLPHEGDAYEPLRRFVDAIISGKGLAVRFRGEDGSELSPEELDQMADSIARNEFEVIDR